MWTKNASYFSGIFFRTNAINTSITTAKSGRIIQVENSGTVGVDVEVGVAVGDCEGVDVGVAFGEFGGPENGGVGVGVAEEGSR